MNYLDKSAKKIKSKQRKRKGGLINKFAVIAASGVAIGGAFVGLFGRRCCDEIKKNIFSNEKNSNEDINHKNEDINNKNKDINIKREEIKKTLKKGLDESVGDVGVAMEKAIDDLEEVNENGIANAN